MSEIAKQLGQRIRELRNERHMSQEELSFKAGISPAHLGQIERALKNPTIDTVSKVAAALGVPVSTLFTEDSVSVPLQNTTVEKINAQLLSMNEDEQKDHSYFPRLSTQESPAFRSGLVSLFNDILSS